MLEHLQTLSHTSLFLLLLTIGAFLFGIWLFKKTKFPLFQPLLIALLIIIPVLKLTGIEYAEFYRQTEILNFMLGPSVVALGYVLYEQSAVLRGNVISILTSIFVGAVVGVVSVIVIARLFGIDRAIIASLEPKSVTTPIAISIAEQNGGLPALAAAFVVICGVFGGIFGPLILRAIGVRSHVARGLAMGASAHALGTAKAVEMGAIEGAVSGLSIGVMGVLTAVLVPVADRLLNL